jgi:nucleoside-diphosphate-sugar epimerase
MARVAITGASGFIGPHLAEALLNRGDEVTCLVRRTSRLDRLKPLGVIVAHGDVTDLESLRKPLAGQDVVFHLGACVRTFRSAEYYRVNGDGTQNIARACAEQEHPPVLIFVSSLAAAGPSPDGRPLTEDHAPRPVSHYGRSKRAGELAVAAWADRVPATIVRAAAVFGEGDRGCLAMLRSIACLGVHLAPVGPPLGLSMIHVADLVHLLILGAERGVRVPSPGREGAAAAQGCYFAAANEQPTYAELGRMMGSALGCHRVLVLPTPRPLVWTLALAGEAFSRIRRRPALLNIDKAREATAGSWFCSSERAAAELGFSVATPLSDRLRQTVQWYRDHRWL